MFVTLSTKQTADLSRAGRVPEPAKMALLGLSGLGASYWFAGGLETFPTDFHKLTRASGSVFIFRPMAYETQTPLAFAKAGTLVTA